MKNSTEPPTHGQSAHQEDQEKRLFLKNPFEFKFPSHDGYVSSSAETDQIHHQRTSSDSFLIEQPSWLQELLDEPDSPLSKGHRRSRSDSVTFSDAAARGFTGAPAWEAQTHSSACHQNLWHTPKPDFHRKKNKAWGLPLNSVTRFSKLRPSRDGIAFQNSGSSFGPHERRAVLQSKSTAKHNQEDPKGSSVKADGSNANPSASKADTNRAKHQFAQRSRLKKLQYIAELERNMQILQVEGSEVSAALGYLDQKNLILGMENQALKQRLQSLSQEQLKQFLEQDMLEREIARLKFLHQQQQQQKNSGHPQSKCMEVETQLANLSI